MKESELREPADCSICNQKILHTGIPMFWTMRIERHGVLINAVKRQSGLEMMLGDNVAIAQAMGPDEEMTKSFLGPVDITLCEDCAMENSIVEKAFEKAEEAEGICG